VLFFIFGGEFWIGAVAAKEEGDDGCWGEFAQCRVGGSAAVESSSDRAMTLGYKGTHEEVIR
jgi:hypothetical protein